MRTKFLVASCLLIVSGIMTFAIISRATAEDISTISIYQIFLPFAPKSVSYLPENGPIAFIWNGNIWRVEDDGTDARQLTFVSGCSEPAWSHQENLITYIRKYQISDKYAWEVRILDLSNNQSTVIVPAKLVGTLLGNYYQYSNPRWSPDGLSLYFLAADGTIGGYYIHKIDVKTGVQDQNFSPFGARRFDVAPRTGRIVYTNFSNAYPEFGYYLNLANADGSERVIIVPLEFSVFFGTPRWSPNEKNIAVVASEGVYGDGSIAIFDPQGVLLHVFPQNISPTFSASLDWSPDRQYLIYDSEGILYKLNNLTSTLELFMSGSEPSWGPLISPLRDYMIYTSR